MKREILELTFEKLGIKKYSAAKILNVWDGTFSQKLRGEKKGYRLFDDEICLIVDKLIKEKIVGPKSEDVTRRIKRTQKLEELAVELQILCGQYAVVQLDHDTNELFENKNYVDFVIKLIWLEQATCNKIYNDTFLNKPSPKKIENLFTKVNGNCHEQGPDIPSSSNIYKNDSTIILIIQQNQGVDKLLPELLKILSV